MIFLNEPPKVPKGVRFAATMNTPEKMREIVYLVKNTDVGNIKHDKKISAVGNIKFKKKKQTLKSETIDIRTIFGRLKHHTLK